MGRVAQCNKGKETEVLTHFQYMAPQGALRRLAPHKSAARRPQDTNPHGPPPARHQERRFAPPQGGGRSKKSKQGANGPAGRPTPQAKGARAFYRLPRRCRPFGRQAPRILRGDPIGRGGPAPLAPAGATEPKRQHAEAWRFSANLLFLRARSAFRGPKIAAHAGFWPPKWQWTRGRRKNEEKPQKHTQSQRRAHGRAGEPHARPPRAHTA